MLMSRNYQDVFRAYEYVHIKFDFTRLCFNGKVIIFDTFSFASDSMETAEDKTHHDS